MIDDASSHSEVVLHTAAAVVYRYGPTRSCGAPGGRHVEASTLATSTSSSSTRDKRVDKWEITAGGAWAQVHVLVELADAGVQQASFRVMAWTLETGQVIMNDRLDHCCRWGQVPGDDAAFRRFLSTAGQTYGFRFRSAGKAAECCRVLCHILANMQEMSKLANRLMLANVDLQSGLGLLRIYCPMRPPNVDGEATACKSSGATPTSSGSSQQTSYPRDEDASTKPEDLNGVTHQRRKRAGGTLPTTEENPDATTPMKLTQTSARQSLARFKAIMEATLEEAEENTAFGPTQDAEVTSGPGDDDVSTETFDDDIERRSEAFAAAGRGTEGALQLRSRQARISCPYRSRQEVHVSYNAEHARYEGLPTAWHMANQQFGLPPEVVPKRVVAGYETRIPAVLEMMKTCLLVQGGAHTEGIFRLAPSQRECAATKCAINDGSFTGNADVHTMATLIKVWFRELPASLFSMFPESHIGLLHGLVQLEPSTALQSLEVLPTLHRSLVLWLLDLFVEIVRHERENKMTARSMAIVMAPNLFRVRSDDATTMQKVYRGVAEFVLVLLIERQQQLGSAATSAR